MVPASERWTRRSLVSSDRPATVTPTPTPVNVAGKWSGSWRSYRGRGGSLTASLTHSGATVDGTNRFSGSPCFSGGTVSGTVVGNSWSGSITASKNARVDLSPTASGNQTNGTYFVASDGICPGDAGTFTMTRR